MKKRKERKKHFRKQILSYLYFRIIKKQISAECSDLNVINTDKLSKEIISFPDWLKVWLINEGIHVTNMMII